MIFDDHTRKPESPWRVAWLGLPLVTGLILFGWAGCHSDTNGVGPGDGGVGVSSSPTSRATPETAVVTPSPDVEKSGVPSGPSVAEQNGGTTAPDTGQSPPPLVAIPDDKPSTPLALAHPHDPGVDHIALGRQALAKGDTKTAISELRKAVFDLGTYQSYMELGRAAKVAKKPDLAFQAFDAAATADTSKAEPLILEARLSLSQKKIVKGLDEIDRALSRDSNRADALNVRGRLEMARQQYDRAILAFGKAIDVDPAYVWAYNNKGYVELLIGRYKDAVDDLEVATTLEPVRAYMWNNLGLAYEKSHEIGKAREAFNEALAMKPGYVVAELNLQRVRKVALVTPADVPEQ